MVSIQDEVADRLLSLANREFAFATSEAARLQFGQHTIFLIEACRVLDYQHVAQYMSSNPATKISQFDFDVLVRGWNPLLGILLPHIEEMGGIPAMKSTHEFRGFVFRLLENLGRAALLRENAKMIRHGMAEGSIDGDTITIRMSERCNLDHWLDRLEEEPLKRINEKYGDSLYKTLIESCRVHDLDQRLDALLFPWKPSAGTTMVGYGTEPDIDAYFFALVTEFVSESRSDAGIHPDAQIGSVSGSDLTLIVFLITSFYLKHIRFVDRGKRKHPEVDYAASLSIWIAPRELIASIANFTGMPHSTIAGAIDLITAKPEHHAYFRDEPTMFMPMLIRLSENYLLAPISSIFRNPFHGIRMLCDLNNGGVLPGIREPREQWMISELYALFLGNRYKCSKGPTRLRRNGRIVTDIDAAILDYTTGEIAVFQLKWQDFNSNDVTKQRSRAKNFVENVDSWATAVERWIAESGTSALCRALRLRSGGPIRRVHLFAIGRSAARFRSYGYAPTNEAVVSSVWQQFVRLRHDIGPSENVFADLHAALRAEQTKPVKTTALRQEMLYGENRIIFENLWNQFDDGLEE